MNVSAHKHTALSRGLVAGYGQLALWLCWIGWPGWLGAHVDNWNVVFEGTAGPYPVRVVVRPPGVVPGLAEISVRALTNGVNKVSVLPMHWETGMEGAPPPDMASLVTGDQNLFAAQLWLMTPGSYSVHVQVEGARGSGQVIVPVQSVATNQLVMSPAYGTFLAGLGLFLCLLMASIFSAALRESVLDPGTRPGAWRRWGGRAVMVAACLGLGSAASAGKRWWDAVDRDYRNDMLFRQELVDARVVSPPAGGRVLELQLGSPGEDGRDATPLVPDHGKLMHLYLIGKPDMDAMAHLHPIRDGPQTFRAVLPELPVGPYALYADVTRESGLAQTLTGSFLLAPETDTPSAHFPGRLRSDPDDSFHTGGTSPRDGTMEVILPEGLRVVLENARELRAGKDVALRVAVYDSAGERAFLKPYLGMFSHAILREKNGSLFMHLHPSGTISIASQQVMTLRSQGKAPGIIMSQSSEPFCKDPPPEEGNRPLLFPCMVPRPGDYRLWIQIKPEQTVRTAVFDVRIAPP